MKNPVRKLKSFRRSVYGLRMYVPWLRERHILEAMVGPLGYWNKLQAYQLNVLVSNGLKPNHTLLDIGCGPLQGGIAFIKYLEKNNYYGLDINEKKLNAGKGQIVKHGLENKNPHLFISKPGEYGILDGNSFDYMWASQVLYYFNDDMIKSLIKMISQKLNKNGKFLADIIGPYHYESKTREYGWNLHSIESLNKITEVFQLKVRRIGVLSQYGYPKRVGMSSSLLIEIAK